MLLNYYGPTKEGSLTHGCVVDSLSFVQVQKLLRSGMYKPAEGEWDGILKHVDLTAGDQIPNILRGQRCFIIGGGRSAKNIDLSILDNEFTISINHGYKHYPKSKVVIYQDRKFIQEERENLKYFQGLQFASFKCRDWVEQGPKVCLFSNSKADVSPELSQGLYNGRLTGLTAINLALIMGASEIYLIGYDMSGTGYWYNELTKEECQQQELNFEKKIHLFDAFKDYSERIFNCNPKSAINQFYTAGLNEVLARPEKEREENKTIVTIADNIKRVRPASSKLPTYPTSPPEKLARIDGRLRGKRVFVLGSGSSLKDFDFNRLNSEQTIAVNHTLRYYPRATHHLFGAPMVLPNVRPLYWSYKGLVFASHNVDLGPELWNRDKFYTYRKRFCDEGISLSLIDGLYNERNSGMEAVSLALIMGASEIYLLGIDYRAVNGEYYFHGEQNFTNNVEFYDQRLKSDLDSWDAFLPYRDKIINCSQTSRLKLFEYKNIDEVLSEPINTKEESNVTIKTNPDIRGSQSHILQSY